MHIAKHTILLATQFGWHIFMIESFHETIDAAIQRPNVNFLIAQQLFQGVCHLTAKFNGEFGVIIFVYFTNGRGLWSRRRMSYLDVIDVIEPSELTEVLDAVDVVDACEFVDANEIGRIGAS